MIQPSTLRAAIVAKLQAIDDLVEAMDRNEDSIYEYDDIYPIADSLPAAIRKMSAPAVMVRYRGLSEATPGGRFGHAITLYVRPAIGSSYSDLAHTIMTGIPTGETLELYNLQLYANTQPPRFEGEITPQTDEAGLEFMEINFVLEEF